MEVIKRPLNGFESTKLAQCIQELEGFVASKLNWGAIVVLVVLIVLSAIHIYHFDKSNWSLISKVLVTGCPMMIWVIISGHYKNKRRRKKELEELEIISSEHAINVLPIQASRMIRFAEHEDEGTHYLVEQVNGVCFYIWDDMYLGPETGLYLSSRFDIYLDDSFCYAIDEKVYNYGETIQTVEVDRHHKFIYFKERGYPADLQIEERTFDVIVQEINQLV